MKKVYSLIVYHYDNSIGHNKPGHLIRFCQLFAIIYLFQLLTNFISYSFSYFVTNESGMNNFYLETEEFSQ